jgi:hypothetical protein
MTASAHHVDRIRGEAAMAATTVHTTCRNQQLWKQFRNLPVACREMLDAFVSNRMQQAVPAAEHVGPQQLEDPHGSHYDVPPSDPGWSAGGLLVALEDGFRLHRLIDPTSTPADSFFEAVERLQRLIAA